MKQKEIPAIRPKEGWLEEDPMIILSTVMDCIEEVCQECREKDINLKRIKGIGIANQRETTILWDKDTGRPLYNAVVWSDSRTAKLAEKMIELTPGQDKYFFQAVCGLPIDPYFSALKIKWLMENCENVKQAIDERRCYFGTVDTWLMWNLTGGVAGGCHVTDVSNANRTMLMNIETVSWDDQLCNFFQVPQTILPKIVSSAEIYGHLVSGPLAGVPLCGCLGDQSAALVGQHCFRKGMAKNTYGTGCFLLYNTGTRPVVSHHGLLATVGYQMGPREPVYYALEGSIAVGGQVVGWLRDKLGIIDKPSDVGVLASKVDNTAGVYFVPAFNGLYAPYWDPTARGLIIGLTAFADKNHIARAALESVCFQTREILEAMSKDSGIAISTLHVDGGMTVNKVFMQIQSDILGMPVDRPRMVETTALGAAMAAGVAVGVDLDRWQNADEMISYTPSTTSDDRDSTYSKWKEAVKRSLSWDVVPEETPPSFPVGMVTAIGGIVFAATAGSLLYLLRRGR